MRIVDDEEESNQNDVERLLYKEENLMDGAQKRFDEENFLGALTMLNRRAEMYPDSPDSLALYADVYESISLYRLAADIWFRFLDICNEADFYEAYEGLGVCYMNLGDQELSNHFFRLALRTNLDDPDELDHVDEVIEQSIFAKEQYKPNLRLVYDNGEDLTDHVVLEEGMDHVREGELDKAMDSFNSIPPDHEDYYAACGFSAMCLLIEGNVQGAKEKCEEVLDHAPDNVDLLTTYCAVLDALEQKDQAREVAKRLATAPCKNSEDKMRVVSALCETGLDKEAYERLTELVEEIPYSDDALWLHAAAACKTGHMDDAIESLETLTTVYPKHTVARFYLEKLRGGEEVEIDYAYRLPEEEYKTIMSFFIAVHSANKREAELFGRGETEDYVRMAFDQLNGRDDKMMKLAAEAAVKCNLVRCVRELLLDTSVSNAIKISILRDLTLRNEENSYGVVIAHRYEEFYTHEIEIGSHKKKQFMKAFADLYSKFAMVGQEGQDKLCNTAEEVYAVLEDEGVADYFSETAEIEAVILREARLYGYRFTLEKICDLLDANQSRVKEILNYLI